jgi:hypothetical protein
MSDQPDLDYTINDDTEVECPYCHKTMYMVDAIHEIANPSFDRECDHCERMVHFDVDYDVTVLAWKPEARR